MRFRPRSTRRRNDRVVLNFASMIDVIFLLLIYFMVTTMLSTPEDRLSSALQSRRDPSAGSHADFQPQIVDVMLLGGEPAYRLGTRILHTPEQLREALEPLNKDTGLFIKVHDEPLVGFVIAAFQAGHDSGFESITYVIPD